MLARMDLPPTATAWSRMPSRCHLLEKAAPRGWPDGTHDVCIDPTKEPTASQGFLQEHPECARLASPSGGQAVRALAGSLPA